MPLDLAKLRIALGKHPEGRCFNGADSLELLFLAERAQRYEAALREIADDGWRDASNIARKNLRD